MIDEEKTFRDKWYYSTELSHASVKEVWAVCEGESCEREGGRGRWVRFRDYRDLCRLCAQKNRHILKDEDKTEKLPWIDDDITFAEKGYRSTWLKPGSNKLVWAICANHDCERVGGRGRWVKFQHCSEICRLCSLRTEECRTKISNAMQGENNPNYGISFSDEHRRKIRETHADVSGENNPNWNGGISFEPYCEKFNNAFRESIREKFGRKCFMCPTTEEKNGRKLSVHHVNYDKDCICNGKDCEFVLLCSKCHPKTNYDRELWERLIINTLSYEGWI